MMLILKQVVATNETKDKCCRYVSILLNEHCIPILKYSNL